MMGVILLFVTILNSLFRLTINSKFICVCEKIIVVAYTCTLVYNYITNLQYYQNSKKR